MIFLEYPPFNELNAVIGKEPYIYNLTGSSAALLLALFERQFLAVEPTEEAAAEFCRDINFFREVSEREPVLFLPDPDGPALSGERASLLYGMAGSSIVTSSVNLRAPLWFGETLDKAAILLKEGREIGRTALERRLEEAGYRKVPVVSEKGEYSTRGWIFDLFPSTADMPIRLEFFGDEIDSMKAFDVETQRSVKPVREFRVFPAAEPASGIELLTLASEAVHIFSESIRDKEGLPAQASWYSRQSVKSPGHDAGTISIRGLGITFDERHRLEELPERLLTLSAMHRIVIVASSQGQAERLKQILRDGDVIAPILEKTSIPGYEGNVAITIGMLSSGFFLPGLMILTEKEIFGGRPGFRPIKKSRVSRLLSSIEDLRPGDFVVHRDHGIGRFVGLMHQSFDGREEELMTLQYDGGRLYLPLHNIGRITKYHAAEGVVPKIDRLGGRTWQRTKEKVKQKIRDQAEKLISLYAEREVHKGHPFSQDTEMHREFDSFFPYEETPDQLKAVEEIKKDMEADRPMDRLVCGDVGYGKTEVAMRAAFKAVYDGMQVAVLVPTTILCEQHYRTFKSRFSAFPVAIDYLSRFKSAAEKKTTIKALSEGNIDIILGTHSLLGKDVVFNKLGLLVIDEEHRFGVGQKEKMKQLRRGVDVLTLTATPIPRTLSMALSDIRDMSTIETPPEERLAVKSVVSVFDEKLIREAFEHELDRNGQIFFVHNRIRDIHKIADFLQRLLPSLRIAVAHGQMGERELEKIMLGFYERTIDVLVSTAIIGSGLDIPNANTIIINRADTMGLADLYQLKGRVGRGTTRACAYFLIPGTDTISEEARQRLQAIQEMSYLGAGFRLALKDLEIRGAGNLLGAEQSGHIDAVGFDLYMELLEKAVAELKGQKIEEEFEPSIDLKVNAFIPEEYIEDMTLRLTTYRKIASAHSHERLEALESEVADSFGKLPEEVRNLLWIMSLKITARELLIKRIRDDNGRINVLFSSETKVEPADIFRLKETRDGRMRFLPEGFELNLRGLPWGEVYRNLQGTINELKKG